MQIELAGTDEKSFVDVYTLLVKLHRQGGYATLDNEKATRNTYGVLLEGMTLLARDEDGTAIGVLALTELPFWYSQETHILDAGFYVEPEHRANGVGNALLAEAKKIADARDRILFITVTDPDRRPKRTKASLDAQTLGYVPLGYTLRLR